MRFTSRIPLDLQEKAHNYFIILHLFKEIHSRNIIAESCNLQVGEMSVGSMAEWFRVIFTTAMLTRLVVQLPPNPRCCVLGQGASRQLSLLGGI